MSNEKGGLRRSTRNNKGVEGSESISPVQIDILPTLKKKSKKKNPRGRPKRQKGNLPSEAELSTSSIKTVVLPEVTKSTMKKMPKKDLLSEAESSTSEIKITELPNERQRPMSSKNVTLPLTNGTNSQLSNSLLPKLNIFDIIPDQSAEREKKFWEVEKRKLEKKRKRTAESSESEYESESESQP